MKPRIIKAIATALGLYELGLSYWLHSIDKVKTIVTQKPPVIVVASPTSNVNIMPPVSLHPPYSQVVEVIPPPWYANLWPEALALGLALLIVPWVREIHQAIRVAYRKWYDWEFGWEKELNEKH